MLVPQNGSFMKENPMKIDDLEVPLFQETSKFIVYIFLSIIYKIYT